MPPGLLHHFHTRRAWDDKNYSKLSNDDIVFINEGKERFGSPELENLYRRWRAGEITERCTIRLRSSPHAFAGEHYLLDSERTGGAVQRHPHWAVGMPVKSSEETFFTRDFTSDFSPGWR